MMLDDTGLVDLRGSWKGLRRLRLSVWTLCLSWGGSID